MLRDNVDLFAWEPSYMSGIDLKVVCHQLSLDPPSKVVAQRKRKNGEEKRKDIIEEVRSFESRVYTINQIPYLVVQCGHGEEEVKKVTYMRKLHRSQ